MLIVEVDNRGILVKKEFIDLNEMNDIEISKRITEIDYQKTSFIYDFLSSKRQKVNDPLGKRTKNNIYPAITANNNKATILVILIIGFTAGPAVSL